MHDCVGAILEAFEEGALYAWPRLRSSFLTRPRLSGEGLNRGPLGKPRLGLGVWASGVGLAKAHATLVECRWLGEPNSLVEPEARSESQMSASRAGSRRVLLRQESARNP